MATGTLELPIAAAIPPDGSSGNAAPAIQRIQGSESNPKKHFLVAAFDGAGTTKEYLWWYFRMPSDYSSAPIVKLQWMLNAITSNTVNWEVSIGAITPADADTPVEHANAAISEATDAANNTEARRLIESSITLANVDSVVAGDLVFLLVARDPANDTATQDAELIAVVLEYTTA